ncbi:MAG: hypothetical protein M1370_11300 [Bacteroidetes bacterium]|nr:hypothetical protein [Bacteroidota bacterium]
MAFITHSSFFARASSDLTQVDESDDDVDGWPMIRAKVTRRRMRGAVENVPTERVAGVTILSISDGTIVPSDYTGDERIHWIFTI